MPVLKGEKEHLTSVFIFAKAVFFFFLAQFHAVFTVYGKLQHLNIMFVSYKTHRTRLQPPTLSIYDAVKFAKNLNGVQSLSRGFLCLRPFLVSVMNQEKIKLV